MPLPVGTKLGVFEITGSLGAGGMGEVYRARDTKLNRDVAIKVLPEAFAADAERLARFTREAQTLAALNHPNIAAIYGIEGSPPALVMELVDGEDLSEVVSDGGRSLSSGGSAGSKDPASYRQGLPLKESLAIARQIAEALEAAHEQGIIHRDLKPANVKVRVDGTVKVLDFGLARTMDSNVGRGFSRADGESALNSPTMTGLPGTAMGMILGTAAYMSPEQARGKVVDRRADIWAFGVVLYEMLTGKRLFDGSEVTDILASVLRQDIDWTALPADTPLRLRRLLERCLDRDVKQRLRDIGEARVEIAKIESGAPDSASLAGPRAGDSEPASRRVLPWAIAAVAVIAAVILGVVAFSRPAAGGSPIWTSIPAPVMEFSRGLGPALSPDGTRIAFVATDASGASHLWIRALDMQSARVIPGTQGASYPFWSPDGSEIGFFKARKLQKIPAGGGTPQVLADATNPRGAAWSSTGVILFAPAPGFGLHRVPGTGGTAEPITGPANQPSTRPSYPSFLPDGRHFLYTSYREGEFWIGVGSLDDDTYTPVLKAFSRAEYAAGYLVFGSKGALFAQPFDPDGLMLGGERVRIIESIGNMGGYHLNYSFSTAGDVIAAGNAPYLPLRQLTWLDGTGKITGVLGEPAHLFGVSVNAAGTRAVAERFNPAVNAIDPWVTELASGFTTPMRASVEGALASGAIWSHDGQTVFYAKYEGMGSRPLSGGAETVWPMEPHWPQSSSPDGRYVLIDRTNIGTDSDLMLVSLAGDHTPVPYLQTPFSEGSARFSPNGQSVAYVSGETGRGEVYVDSFPRRGNMIPVSTAGGAFPQWSEDGKAVYYLSAAPDGRTMMTMATIGSTASPRRLFALALELGDGFRSPYAVFDNGRRFLVLAPVPVTAPQVITIGQHWTATLRKR